LIGSKAQQALHGQDTCKQNRMSLINSKKRLSFQKEEKEKRAAALIVANKELAFQNKAKKKRAAELTVANKEKGKRAAELIIADKELIFQSKEKGKRAAELILANKELVYQNQEKGKRAAELIVANKELVYQNEEKGKRAAELIIANTELVYQTEEKEKRAAELIIADTELAYQNAEKEKRAAELIIANKELNYQNEEKGKRAAELVIANAARKKDEEYIEYLAAIVESSDDAIISKSLDGVIKSWNKGGEKMFGYTSREAVGSHISLIIPPGYINEDKKIVERIRNNETIAHFETVRNKKNGELFYVSLTVSPLKDRAGNIIGISKIIRDITSRKMSEKEKEQRAAELIIANKELAFQNEEKEKRAAELIIANNELAFQNEEKEKRAAKLIIANKELAFQNEEKEKRAAELIIANEELAFQNEEKEKRAAELSLANSELKKAEEQFRLVVESAPNAMVLVNNEGFITLVNNQTEKLFGYKRNELVGNKLEILLPEQFRQRHPDHRQAFFKKPQTRSMGAGRDLFALKKNGTEIQVEIGLNPIETGKGFMVLASIIDITEKKIQEAAQKKHNKDLAQFAYVASHDLQEPLRTVSNYMHVFEEDYLPLLDDNARMYLRSVNNATKRMSMLVKSLLAFSRLGHNKKLTFVDCKIVMNDVIADLGTMIKTSNTIIEVTDLPQLNGYETEIRQVFQNLIINAIKFQKKGTQPKIQIRAERANDKWKFSVSDNGIGIAPSHFERVFDIFQRLHTNEEYEGSGIGLANCKKIIQLHQGDIWIESTLGHGSTFYFTIPTLTI